MTPVTLDTGAMIAIERNRPRGVMLLKAAAERRFQLLVPTVVHAEWWRGRSDVRERMKAAISLVPFPIAAAEAAGVVLGRIAGEHRRAGLAVDVMVVAFAATVGGSVVFSSDPDDLQRISAHFPSVRVLAV
jgi:predicted nucleic acid-binding protein